MIHEEVLNHEPIQINTLYSLSDVAECYYLVGYNVVNINTGHIKTINRFSARKHYPYVTLETKTKLKNKKVTLHKILALAYLHNGPYELIEHLDDNPENYRIDNLLISNRSANAKRAFCNGHSNRIENIFELEMYDGCIYYGTMKELSSMTGIPRQTIYCRYYKGSPGEIIKSVKLIPGQQTIERVPAA